MARFRQRFSVDQLNAINETICEQDKKDDDGLSPATSGEPKNPAKTTENKDKLIMDATCVPADIRRSIDTVLLPRWEELFKQLEYNSVRKRQVRYNE